MEKREKLEVGNNSVEAEREFASGYYNGSLYYYDINYQLPQPITGEAIGTLMMRNLFDQQATPQWNTGFVFGWITALCENNPAFFFTSIIHPELAIAAELLPTATQGI